MMKKKKKILLAVLSTVMTAACAFGVAGCNVGGGAQNNSTDVETEFKTAYALYVTYAEANGETPTSYEEWLATIKGEKGDDGEDGKSAYQIWLDNGHTGTQADFLEWLKGATGEVGPQGPQGEAGPQGATGADGKSAYQIWLDNGHTGTQADFLEWLNGTAGVEGPQGPQGETGPQGAMGADGKSAYQIWLDNGHEGTEADFLEWLKGATGEVGSQGPQGETGPQGPQGEQGVGIESIECDEEGNWIITFTDGTVQIVETPYADFTKLLIDQQMVCEMNVAISKAIAVEGDLNVEAAMKALDEAGYNVLEKDIHPISKGHEFYWDDDTDTIVLVKGDKVVYPKNHKNPFNANWTNLSVGSREFANLEVGTAADLVTALTNGQKQVTLTEDIKITGTIAVENNAVINLNGKKLDASRNSSRPFDVVGNTTLTINAKGSTVNVGKYGLVNVKADANVTVVINGGTYIANENSDNGAFLKVREGASANITLNNVNYTDTTGENFILNAAGATANVTVNGGTYKAAKGFQTSVATFNNVTIETDGYAVEAGNGSTFTGCTIKTGDLVVNGVKPAAICAAKGATITVKDCNISGTNGLSILPGEKAFDGAIIVTNTTNTATNPYYLYNGTAVGYIEVDGVVVAGTK